MVIDPSGLLPIDTHDGMRKAVEIVDKWLRALAPIRTCGRDVEQHALLLWHQLDACGLGTPKAEISALPHPIDGDVDVRVRWPTWPYKIVVHAADDGRLFGIDPFPEPTYEFETRVFAGLAIRRRFDHMGRLHTTPPDYPEPSVPPTPRNVPLRGPSERLTTAAFAERMRLKRRLQKS